MSEYTFVRVSSDNLSHLQLLYKVAFNTIVSIDFFKKKFDTSAMGVEWLGYIAFDNAGTPAAYYGVFPCICDYFGEKILVAQSGDTMTHPDHRGKGLFIQLATKTYDLAKNSGVKFVFGFPNKNSYPGFVNKLNWVHNEDLNIYKIKVFTLPLAKVVKKVKFLQPLYDFYCKAIVGNFTSKDKYFNNSVCNETYAGVYHDKLFFDYKKYYESYILLIQSKKVWLKFDGRLWIGDIEKLSKLDFEKVIKTLKRIAFFCGTSDIVFHGSPKTDLELLFSQVYKVDSNSPIGYLNFDDRINVDSVKYHSADFDTF